MPDCIALLLGYHTTTCALAVVQLYVCAIANCPSGTWSQTLGHGLMVFTIQKSWAQQSIQFSLSLMQGCQQCVLSNVWCCSAEVHMADGPPRPCAVKRLPFDQPDERGNALAELAALHATHNMPGISKCVAVFGHTDLDNKQSLYIATE